MRLLKNLITFAVTSFAIVGIALIVIGIIKKGDDGYAMMGMCIALVFVCCLVSFVFALFQPAGFRRKAFEYFFRNGALMWCFGGGRLRDSFQDADLFMMWKRGDLRRVAKKRLQAYMSLAY